MVATLFLLYGLFYYCNSMLLIVIYYCMLVTYFFIIKLENGLKKHVRNIARTNNGFIVLVVTLFTLNLRCDY